MGRRRGHWAGQRGHAALTRGIREELRDWLGRWFWDNINPCAPFLGLLSTEDVGAGVMKKTVAALKKKKLVFPANAMLFIKIHEHCCYTFRGAVYYCVNDECFVFFSDSQMVTFFFQPSKLAELS